MWFKKKKKEIITKPSEMKGESFGAAIDGFKAKNRVCGEPVTLAALRLAGGANDVGSSNALRMFNNHKTRLQNQWVNPAQSINSGYGTAQLATYFYQVVNYYECYTLAQDGLFQNIFNILSDTPYSKGGELAGEYSEEQKTDYENLFRNCNVFETAKAALRSSYVCGGCLVYMDFGLSEDELGRKLDLKRTDMRKFKGFRRIDPINVVALDVNTVDPAKADYMRPAKWYVIGLGVVDSSHFLQFEKNTPELLMRPLCMYFGFPLTLLVKNDVANASQASQGLANLMNRFRYLYLKTDITNIATNPQAFKDRLEWMSLVQDNYAVAPIKNEEEISQLTTSLAGMSETVYMFYELVSARTGIPQSVLLGKGNQGLSGTLEGDRRNWYDNVRRIQSEEKPNLLKMMGIAAGTKTGKFVEFDDYVFAPLEEATEKELAENLRSFAEAARALIEMGAKPDGVLNWIKNFKQFSLDEVEFDAETEGLTDYEDITPEVYAEYKAENAWVENPERWITMKHQPVPVDKGQTSKDAAKKFLEDKGRTFKDRESAAKKDDGFKIERETKKALLLKKDGKTFWIQKRWMREDGSLTPSGQQAFKDAQTDEEKEKGKAEEKARWAEGVKLPKPSWESEKAYGFDVSLDFYDTEVTKRHRIFIPKSQIQKNGNIPSWLLKKKFEELSEAYPYQRYGGYHITSHPFTGAVLGERDMSAYGKEFADEPLYLKNAAPELYAYEQGVLIVSVDNGSHWDESKHPRDKDGKFGSGEGEINSVSGKKSKDDFYGEEFKGVKGKEAIKKVIAEKRGHVKDAFTRKDIGGIDLVWGNEEGGLRHILEGRSNYGDLDDFVTSLSDVIENGSIIINKDGKFEIWFERKIAVVSPDYNGDDNIKFLITGFKQKKPNQGRGYK